MHKFLRKQEALKEYKNRDNKNLSLFQEDIDRAGSKCFYVATPKLIFDKISKLQDPHFYEFWADDTKMKFVVDIDYDLTKADIKPDDLLKKVIDIVFKGANKYYEHTYKIEDVIVLENDINAQKIDNPNKYSAHIVFRGLTFQNNLVSKDFYMRLNKDYKISKYYVDKSIYNMTCLRLYLNSKMSKTAILVPKKLEIDNKFTTICEKNNIYNFFLETMITQINNNDNIITKCEYVSAKNDSKNSNITSGSSDISNVNIDTILNDLPHKYCDEYDTWYKIGRILHTHSTSENNLFELWNKWSSKSSKYKEKEMLSKWNEYYKTESKLTIGTLIKWARDEGIVNIFKNNSISKLEEIIKSYPIKPIQIKTDDNTIVLDQSKLEPDVFTSVLDKTLIAVQSEKGTGKTSNLLKKLFTDKNSKITDKTSILFVSSRVSFGYKLLGDLKEYGFNLYSEVNEYYINADRVICQIDSLMRLNRDTYDIIIIDECETLARYMTSLHFTKNQKANLIVSTLEQIVADANQRIIMDADLSDRCVNFYKKIIYGTLESPLIEKTYKLIINNYRPYKDYTLACCNYSVWLNNIFSKIESNKKVAIGMASNTKAKDLEKILKDTYIEKKILLIHKETNDLDKKILLQNVNEEWTKYDVIIYTPTVCMGVSFDIPNYFDSLFMYGCHKSLGAQELCQMMHRVRSPINKEILISMDNYKQYDIDDNIDYSIVEKMLCSDYYLTHYNLHTNIVPKKVKRINNISECITSLDFGINNIDDNPQNLQVSNLDDNKENIHSLIGSVTLHEKILTYPYRNEPIYDLYVRNSMEIIENESNLPACFFGYAKYKEYNFKYLSSTENNDILNEMKEIKVEREELELEEKIHSILEAPELTKDEYLNKIKQKDEYITQNDIYAIQRYNLRNCYNNNGIINRSFVEEYCDKEKMKWYRNLSTILSSENQETKDKLEILKTNQQNTSVITNCYMDFTNKNKYTYHYYPIEIIKNMGFDINNLEILVSHTNILNHLSNTIEWCEENKYEIAFKYNIKIKSKKLIDLQDNIKLKYINTILKSQYGLVIKKINKTTVKDNLLYKLDDCEVWKNLPNSDNSDNSNKKIKSINLKCFNHNNLNDYDTSKLDIFVYDD
jgi:hypothetical protein